jgi:hypothetical protein
MARPDSGKVAIPTPRNCRGTKRQVRGRRGMRVITRFEVVRERRKGGGVGVGRVGTGKRGERRLGEVNRGCCG